MTRTEIDAILAFIGTTSLTDDEWSSMDIDDESNDRDVYEALLLVLDERGSLTNYQDRLTSYYAAKGISFEAATGKSNIFVGSDLS